MPSGIKICKVCGIEYPYCHTNTTDKFRWQDVACSKEHAMEYFALIEASRAGVQPPESKVEEEEFMTPPVESDDEIATSEEESVKTHLRRKRR